MFDQLFVLSLFAFIVGFIFYLLMNQIDKKSKFKRSEIRYIEIKAKTKFNKERQVHFLKILNRYYAFIISLAVFLIFSIASLWIAFIMAAILIVGGLMLSVKWMNVYVDKIIASKRSKKTQI